ncbi:MAG: hypothetical protein IJV83_00115 [Clostridia bacterium]|nr:hypothetical protein [Clostridia bacterium]
MKRWQSLCMAAAMACSFGVATACGDEGKSEAKSNITVDQALTQITVLEQSLADVKGFDLSAGINFGFSLGGITMDYENSANGVIALKENDFDAKFSLVSTTRQEAPDMDYFETETESEDFYLIDGYGYFGTVEDGTLYYSKSTKTLYEAISESFEKELEISIDDLLEKISAMQGENAVEIPQEVTAALKQIVTDEFLLIQSGDSTRITLDLEDQFNEVFEFYGDLSLDSTVGELINDYLSLADVDWTWQELTGALKGKNLGDYKISTIVDFVDNQLYRETEMHLDDIKNFLFEQDVFYDMMKKWLGDSSANAYKNKTLEEIIGEYGSLTINELLQAALEDETLTLDIFITTLENNLNTRTLGDTMDAEDKAEFEEITDLLGSVSADALNANFIYTIKNGKVSALEFSFNVDISVEMPMEEGVTAEAGVYANCLIQATNFSATTQPIALPQGAQIRDLFDW